MTVADERLKRLLISRVAGDGERAHRFAVKRSVARQEATTAGRRASQFDRRFDSLGAAVAEEGHLEAARSHGDEFFGERRRVGIHGRRREAGGLLTDSRSDCLGNGRMVVSEVQRAKAGDEVEIFFAGRVVKVLAFPADEGLEQAARPVHCHQNGIDVAGVELGGAVGQLSRCRHRSFGGRRRVRRAASHLPRVF